MDKPRLLERWLTFNMVGGLGVGVQLGTLAVLVNGVGLHYLLATAIAVESAVLHNFIWHDRWTWRDRPSRSARTRTLRLMRFHLTNGMVSLVGNMAVMIVLVGALDIPPVVANLGAIVICSTVNFFASEALVFKATGTAVLTAALVTVPTTARADTGLTELTAAAIAAWQQYEKQVDERYNKPPETGRFFVHDAYGLDKGWRTSVMAGGVSMVRVPSFKPGAAEPSVPDGRIHHWAGAVFIPGLTLDDVLRHLKERAGRESEAYSDVLASRLISRNGDELRVFMKLRRESIITVTYNTEHEVLYKRLSPALASSRSVATKIAELEAAGTKEEREKPVGQDHGFLWRLNAYWRYQQVDGGVIVECESASLSRGVPMLLRPFVTGTVERIARESLQKTLESLRAEFKKR